MGSVLLLGDNLSMGFQRVRGEGFLKVNRKRPVAFIAGMGD